MLGGLSEELATHTSALPCPLPTGVVGDWQEHFTPEQNAKFNAVYQAQMKDCSLHLPWTMD